MKYFADCHFHAMTMNEPNFAAFINSFYSFSWETIPISTTENYIITPNLLKGDHFMNTISNTLTAFERPISETLKMMEDDLKGMYTSENKAGYAPLIPYIFDGKLQFRDKEYDKMLMIPLVMDFSQNQQNLDRLYYKLPAIDKLTPYLESTITGIKEYYKACPDGLFEFYPFAGINPKMHSLEFVENFLNKYINTSHKFHPNHVVSSKPFYGIKIYPPLDYNPWPEDPETLEKHMLIYSFCQKNRVPIITHCDDQGFRGIDTRKAWEYTDPATWRTVLENYPNLVIDFAHFGSQYARISNRDSRSLIARKKRMLNSPWFRSIISLMEDFDGVYADLSFSGCNIEFYEKLNTYLDSVEEKTRETILSRILFGSDFSINLLKVESYTQFYSIFDSSPFSNEEVEKFTSINPISFLGLSEPKPVLGRSKRVRTLE